jgi:hypothetical protein
LTISYSRNRTGVFDRPRTMKPMKVTRFVLLCALLGPAAAACGSTAPTVADVPPDVSSPALSPWLAAAQLPDDKQVGWAQSQHPATVPQAKMREALQVTNFPTTPPACRLPIAAVQDSSGLQDDLFVATAHPPTGPSTFMPSNQPAKDGAAQFLLSYQTSAAADQAYVQISDAVQACSKSLNQTRPTNSGATGTLDNPLGGAYALAAQLAQSQPECIDAYSIARCMKVLSQRLPASTALDAEASIILDLPGFGSGERGFVQSDSIYVVQRGEVISILFLDDSLGYTTAIADPTPVVQTMANDLSGASSK